MPDLLCRRCSFPHIDKVCVPSSFSSGLIRLQTLPNELACSSIIGVSVDDGLQAREDSIYLVIGNSFSARAASLASLNVYKWNRFAQRFQFHHSPIFSSDQKAYVSRLHSVPIAGKFGRTEYFLAVANFWDGESTVVDSILLRFDAVATRFVEVAPMRGSAATDVQLVPLGEPGQALVLVSNLEPATCRDEIMTAGFIAVYNMSMGATGNWVLNVIQCIESRGAVDLESFNVDGQRMVAVSQRQVEDDVSLETPSYQQSSAVYVWSEEEHQYRHLQELGTSFASVPDSRSTQDQKQRFCSAGGVPGEASECLRDVGVNRSGVPGLRGATSTHFFVWDGEGYLAVAQSVCPLFAGDFICRDQDMAQPQSAVLQYDPRRRMFTEMKRLTRSDSERTRGTSAKDSDFIAESAMRFDGGRAASIKFVQLNNEPFLLLCSLTRGAILMRWQFETVSGLVAVNALATDPTGSRVVSASASARTLSVISLGHGSAAVPSSLDPSNFDDLGRPVCDILPCFVSKPALKESINVPLTENTLPNVLGGLRHISWSPQGWVAQTGLPTAELLCSAAMLPTVIPGAPEMRELGMLTGLIPLEFLDPPCQSLAFTLEGSGDLNMFDELPKMSSDGTLSYKQAAEGWGVATFVAHLQDSAGGQYSSAFRINIAPAFKLAFEVISPEISVDAIPFTEHRVVVVHHFMHGRNYLFGDSIPRLSCDMEVANSSLFATDPMFSVTQENSTNAILGSISFEVRQYESGRSDVHIKCAYQLRALSTQPWDSVFEPEERSYFDLSATMSFTVNALSRNYRPLVGIIPDVVTVEGSGPVVLPCWFQLSAGSPYETAQSLQIYQTDAELINGSFAVENMIRDLLVKHNPGAGCADISFSPLPSVNGALRLSFVFEDDGGTENRGENSESASMIVHILPVNDRPGFNITDGSKQIELLQGRQDREVMYARYFTVFSPPLDEIQQKVSFSIEFDAPERFSGFVASATANGDLSLHVPASVHGNLTLHVRLEEEALAAHSDREGSTNTVTSNSTSIALTIWPIPPLLDFNMLPFFSAVESSGMHTVNITNITGTAHPEVTIAVSNLRLFKTPPTTACRDHSAPGCSLMFAFADLVHGTSTMSVTLSQLKPDNDAVGDSEPITKVLVLKIFPQPVIQSVRPGVCSHRGGCRVAIHGSHFGSLYSRAYSTNVYTNLSVTIGGKPCTELAFQSDKLVSCIAPPGVIGTNDLYLNISDAHLSRGASSVFKYSNVIVAGGRQGGGFVGVQAFPNVETLDVKLNRAVRCVATWRGSVFLGGSFTRADDRDTAHILRYDGATTQSLGRGVDGVVNSMSVFKYPIFGADGTPSTERSLGSTESELLTELLVVGGSFNYAMDLQNRIAVTGALAAWNPSTEQWLAISATYAGRVDVIMHNASSLYVAGTMRCAILSASVCVPAASFFKDDMRVVTQTSIHGHNLLTLTHPHTCKTSTCAHVLSRALSPPLMSLSVNNKNQPRATAAFSPIAFGRHVIAVMVYTPGCNLQRLHLAGHRERDGYLFQR